jgi:hypothetical protein
MAPALWLSPAKIPPSAGFLRRGYLKITANGKISWKRGSQDPPVLIFCGDSGF